MNTYYKKNAALIGARQFFSREAVTHSPSHEFKVLPHIAEIILSITSHVNARESTSIK